MSEHSLLLTRIDELERQVRELDHELGAIRRKVVFLGAAETPDFSPPAPAEPRLAKRPRVELPSLELPRLELPSADWNDLLGAKALAWAGGIVTMLGVAFFFVLAVERGWIGPELRVGFGGLASLAVAGAGLWLRRRFGETYASLAAVGAGIAGAYATLLAATALYGLVPQAGALVGATAIAAGAVAVALAWRSELVAGLGLVGALGMPGLLAFDGGLTRVGTAFALFVLVGAFVVGVRERWRALEVVASIVALPQIAGLLVATHGHPAGAVALAGAFWLAWLALGVAEQLARGQRLSSLSTGFVLGGAAFAYGAGALLFDHGGRGVSFACAGIVTGAGALVLARRAPARELATLLGAVALAEVAVAAADLLSGPSLAYAWAAEGAALGLVALRVRRIRFALASLAYLTLAALHVVAIDAPPAHVFEVLRRPAGGAPAAVAVALAVLVAAAALRDWDEDEHDEDGLLRPVAAAAAALRGHRVAVRGTAFVVAALGFVLAGSLGVLALFQARGSDPFESFQHAHLTLTAVWAVLGLAAFVLALLRRRDDARLVAAGWLGVVAAKTATFDREHLPAHLQGYAYLAVAVAVLAAAVLLPLLDERIETLHPLGVAGSLVPLALGLASGVRLSGDDGAAISCVGALYVLLGLAFGLRARHRDFATLLWSLGSVVLAVGEAIALSGIELAGAWAATAVALGAIAAIRAEPRLRIAACGWLLLAAGDALVVEAPPTALLRANAHPADGVAAVLFAASAAAALALLARDRVRPALVALGGGLGVYAASLAILELAERTGSDVHTSFQRGHTAVSALWGIVALTLLYAGLVRDRRGLRIGGLALFGLIVAKIFLYDLATLSSAARALSFLAVGAVLLLGGFFYQRLTAERRRAV